MARLILEEGAARRAFKVGEGKLTIGSGADCTLRLSSPDVADRHAELEIVAGVAFLQPRPGVMPPRIQGQPVTARTPLPHDARFEIGGARFHYLAEDAPPAGEAPTVAHSAGGVVTGATAVRASKARESRHPGARTSGARGLTGREGLSGEAAPTVERTRPRARIQRGMPNWLMFVLIGGAIVVAVVALRQFISEAGTLAIVPEATLERARRHLEAGEMEAARSALTDLERVQLSEPLRNQVRLLQGEIERFQASQQRDIELRREGDTFKATQLERFVRERLAGDNPPPERVRVFLERVREFRQRWPDHPDIDWVDRHERLYSRFVDISKPPTFADIAYKAELSTSGRPRAYDEAADSLREFIARAHGSEREQAVALLDRLAVEEREYFDDQMQQAKYHWDKNERPKAVGILLSLILGLDDPQLVDAAAREYVGLPGFEEYLRSYRRTSPQRYESLIQVPRVRDAARKQGLLEG